MLVYKESRSDTNKRNEVMNKVIHKADTRAHINHLWLDTYHTFSFDKYHNPERMQFGALRVLNEDKIMGGMGFGTHPHENMEVISILLEGELEHKDSLGSLTLLKPGDIQVMSAGSGIFHDERNNKEKPSEFLQIWILPNKHDVEPRYDHLTFDRVEVANKFFQIVSPFPGDQGVWIHQDAWLNIGEFSEGKEVIYKIKNQGNGIYVFVIKGEVVIDGEKLCDKDGIGIWDVDQVNIKTISDSKMLLMDVPMD